MWEFFLKVWASFIEALPDKVVRILLIVVLLGALVLHASAASQITENTEKIIRIEAQSEQVHEDVNKLTDEVREYRREVMEQNRLLREQLGFYGKKQGS